VAARVLTRTPRALAHAPGGGRVLVVPGSLPARTPVLEVAGCRGYEVGAERRSARRRMAAEAGAAAAAAGGGPSADGGSSAGGGVSGGGEGDAP
jgi:hypothetical protein